MHGESRDKCVEQNGDLDNGPREREAKKGKKGEMRERERGRALCVCVSAPIEGKKERGAAPAASIYASVH